MDAEYYKQFIRGIELDDIYIVSATFKRKWQHVSLPESAAVRVNFEPVKWRVDGQTLFVQTRFNVTTSGRATTNDGPEKPDEVLMIEFVVQLEYSVHNQELGQLREEMHEEIVSIFMQRNVPVNVWPYAREFISSTTVRMGFPALVIGTMKINI